MAVALASPFKAHFVTLAKYHRWAYQRLFASVDRLSDEQTRADHGTDAGVRGGVEDVR